MEVDEGLLRDAQAAHDQLEDLQAQAERRRAEFHRAVRRLHAADSSMREIAEALGLSHQRVHQIVSGGEDMPTPTRQRTLLRRLVSGPQGSEGRRPGELILDRFFVDARDAIASAREEAQALNHGFLGTEHLLLGLLRAEHGLAARLLHAVGAELEQCRGAVRNALGSTPAAPDDTLRPTGRLQNVLDLARQEAKTLRSTHVRSEHLLLALAREGGGLGARILADLGVGYRQLSVRAARASLACSFCGTSGLDAFHLVAGPGVYICDRCVELASRPDGRPQGSPEPVPVDRSAASCSFCGKKRADVERLISSGARASICGECLVLCEEIVEEEREAWAPGRG